MTSTPDRHTAFITVGSNIEPEKHIPQAIERLAQSPSVSALRVSAFYVTTPLDRPAQPDYRNGAVRIETDCGPETLKEDVLRPIERALGRKRTDDPFAARTIDLDIVLFDRIVARSALLTLPDPDIRKRAFVAVPLLELEPDLVLPDTGERLDSLPVAHEPLNPDAALSESLRERYAA